VCASVPYVPVGDARFLKTVYRSRKALRLPERDILRVKTIARELGIPYQTFLASVIHRVATGEISVR